MSSPNHPQKPDEQKEDTAEAPPATSSHDDPLSSYASSASLSNIDRELVREFLELQRTFDALVARYGALLSNVADDPGAFARERRAFKNELIQFGIRLLARLPEVIVAGTLSSAPKASSSPAGDSTVRPQELVMSMMDSSPSIQQSSQVSSWKENPSQNRVPDTSTNQGQPQEPVKNMMEPSSIFPESSSASMVARALSSAPMAPSSSKNPLQEPSSVKEKTPQKRTPQISTEEDHQSQEKKKTEKDDKNPGKSYGEKKA